MKKWLSLLLALCLCLSLLAGCGGKTPEKVGESEGNEAEGEAIYYTLAVDAFYCEEDMRIFYVSEGMEDEKVPVEYNNLGFSAVSGDTLSSLMADMGYSDFELVDDNGTFLGWMKYDVREDENGFFIWTRSDDVMYTTEEIMRIPVEGVSLSFVAKWSDIDDSYYAENGY